MKSLLLAEGHPEGAQELACLIIVLRGRDERHVHALGKGHLVRVDLREDELLRQPEAIVAIAIETLRVDPAKVANTGQGDTDQPVQELIHAPAPQRNPAANLVAL